MDLLALIVALSVIMWYVIDRIKPIWEQASFGKYVTLGVAAIFGAALAFTYHLDLVYALEFVAEPSVMGQVLTALVLMGGSSAVSEIIQKIKV